MTNHLINSNQKHLFVCCNLAVKLVLPLAFHFHLGPSRITCWTAEQLQKEKQELSKDNLVWEGCWVALLITEIGTDTQCKLANTSRTKHPSQSQTLSSPHTFPRKPRYKKIPGCAPLESIVKSSGAHLLH